MASQEMQQMSALLREQPLFDATMSVGQLRASLEEAQAGLAVPEDVSHVDETIGGRPARRIRTPGARADRVLLYFHGGGYVMGSLDTHHELMGRLSRACRTEVIGVDYRLAPEHPHPAAVEDAVAAYDALLSGGLPPARIVIGGDSAGGGLTAACLVALREGRKPQPAGAVLFSPWTDLTGSGESVRSRAEVDPMLRPEALRGMAELYHGSTPAAAPGVSPLFADLRGLAPMLIQVGDAEILLDDSTRFAARAREAGVDVDLEVFDEAFHVFQAMPGLPETARALESVARFFDARTGTDLS